jgi:hypothetical protein
MRGELADLLDQRSDFVSVPQGILDQVTTRIARAGKDSQMHGYFSEPARRAISPNMKSMMDPSHEGVLLE